MKSLARLVVYVPISGIPLLVYVHGAVVEEGRGICLWNLPEGLVLSRDCPNPNCIYNSFHCVKNVFGKFDLGEFHRYTHICHTLCTTGGIWGICKQGRRNGGA